MNTDIELSQLLLKRSIARSAEGVLKKGKSCIVLFMLSECIVLASTVSQPDLKIFLLKRFKCCALCFSFILQNQSF